MKRKIIFLVLSFASLQVFSQPFIQWQKCLGSTDYDKAYSILQIADGGYMVAGYSSSNDGDVTGNHGNSDFWIVKLDSSGNLLWQKSLGGSAGDVAYSIQPTSDGGYVVAGSSNSNDGDVTTHHGTTSNSDYWVVKIDSLGNIQWEKSYGGTANDIAYSARQTSDGSYIVAGGAWSFDGEVTGHHGTLSSYADFWILKLDSSGTLLWQKCLGGGTDEVAYSVMETGSGEFVAAGYACSNDGNVIGHHGFPFALPDYWVIKLDTAGNFLWRKCYGGTQYDYGKSIQQTTDAGFIVAGYTNSSNGDVTGNSGTTDYWILKLDSSGNIVWQKDRGGSGTDEAFSVRQTGDGGYIAAGYSNSNNQYVSGNHGFQDYWIMKLDTSGNIAWQKSLGSSSLDEANAILQISDGAFVIAGYTSGNNGDVSGCHGGPDCWIVKTNPFHPVTDVYRLSPDSVCQNLPVIFYCTVTDTMSIGSYELELSDSNGSFVSPQLLGQYNVSFNSASIIISDTVNITNVLPAGCYRLRMNRTTPPLITGTPSGCLKVLYCPGRINITSMTTDSVCQNLPDTIHWQLVDTVSIGTYQVEISDGSGSFASPLLYSQFNIITPQTSGNIPLNITSVPPDTCYRLRVNRITAPTITGNPSACLHVLYCPGRLDVTSITPDTVCQGVPITLNWTLADTISIGTYEVQISDSNGSFISPLSLGQFNITTPQTSGAFSANVTSIPSALCYRLRVNRISAPTITGNTSPACLHILNCPSIMDVTSISPDTICAFSYLVLNWSLSGTVSIGTYQVELSDTNGSFAAPINCGQFHISSPQTSGSVNANVPVSIPASCYKFRINRTTVPTAIGNASPCLQVISCPTTILVGQPTIVNDNACIGSVMDVPISVSGPFFFPNVFTAELSDSSGSFNNPTTVGTLVADVPPYSLLIHGQVPNVPEGCSYYLRVTAYGPPTMSTVYGPFCIRQCDVNSNLLGDLSACIIPSTSPWLQTIFVDAHAFNNNMTYYPGNMFKIQVLDTAMQSAGGTYNFGTASGTGDVSITMRIPRLDTLTMIGMPTGNYYYRVNATLTSDSANSFGTLKRLKIGSPRNGFYNIISLDSSASSTVSQICSGDWINFTTSPQPNNFSSYEWTGSQLQGSPSIDNGMLPVDFTGFMGVFDLQVRENNFECWGNLSNIFNFTIIDCDTIAAVNEISSTVFSFSMFPNPCFEELSLSFRKSGLHEIQITDVLGKSLYKTSSYSLTVQFYMDFHPGIYFITVTDKKKNSETRKVVKM